MLPWGAATPVLVSVAVLVAYILTTGQFPRRVGGEGVELPPDDLEDAAMSLELVQRTVLELAARVELIERAVGIPDAPAEGDDPATPGDDPSVHG